jgi:hypothetical protein
MTIMGRQTVTRWAGLAAMIGGALATGAFATLASRPEGVPGGPYRDADGIGPFLIAALLLGSIGLAGLHARQGGRGGRLGATGLALGLAGAGVLVLGCALLATLGDVLVALLLRGPALLALLAGAILSALGGLRAGALSRTAALAVVATSLVFLAFDLESDRLWFALPFGLAWVWVGHTLWSGWRGPVATTPAGHPGGAREAAREVAR